MAKAKDTAIVTMESEEETPYGHIKTAEQRTIFQQYGEMSGHLL